MCLCISEKQFFKPYNTNLCRQSSVPVDDPIIGYTHRFYAYPVCNLLNVLKLLNLKLVYRPVLIHSVE